MLRIGTVVLGLENVGRAAAVWTRALGYVPRDEIGDDSTVVLLPDGRGPGAAVRRRSKSSRGSIATSKPRTSP